MFPKQDLLTEQRERTLYTLLALHGLGSCTHLQLLDFMVELDIMDDFALPLALSELVDKGFIAKITHPLGDLYKLTEAGQEALDFYTNRVPHSKATLINENAPAWRERFSREQQFTGQVTDHGGEFIARLTLTDGNRPALTLEIPVAEKRLADRLVRFWPDCGADIYQYLIKTFGEAQDKA